MFQYGLPMFSYGLNYGHAMAFQRCCYCFAFRRHARDARVEQKKKHCQLPLCPPKCLILILLRGPTSPLTLIGMGRVYGNCNYNQGAIQHITKITFQSALRRFWNDCARLGIIFLTCLQAMPGYTYCWDMSVEKTVPERKASGVLNTCP